MSAKPSIQHLTLQDPKGRIALVPEMHEPFIRTMDSLYPRLISGSTARKGEGYSAFLVDDDKGTHQFIGSFTGMCLASVRKNPWFKDEGQWFLKALLSGMTLAGHGDDHRSRCHPANYGTLRLWDKLGLGAKRTTRGDYISTTRDAASHEQLRLALRITKGDYVDIRAYADKKAATVTPEQLAVILPTYSPATAIRFSCELIG